MKQVGQALVLYGLCFFLLLVVGSPLQSFSFEIGLAGTLVLLLALPAVVFVRWKGVGVVQGLRLTWVRPSILLPSLLLGFGTWAIGMWIARGISGLGVKSMGHGLDSGLDSPLGFAVFLLVAAVGPGVCEEVLFRGAIQGVLERRGKWFGVIVTALLFGMFHQSLGSAIPAAVMGVFYGWVVIRTGSIIPAMAAHFVNNAAAISFLYFLGGEDPAWLLPCLFGLGVIAMVMIVRASARDDVADSPMSHVPAALPLWGWFGCAAPLIVGAILSVGLISAMPYFVQTRAGPGGDQIVVVEPESPLYESMTQKDHVRVLYTQGDDVRVGEAVEFTRGATRVRDEEGNEIEIPAANIEGVVLTP